jgi:hypothetical protein
MLHTHNLSVKGIYGFRMGKKRSIVDGRVFEAEWNGKKMLTGSFSNIVKFRENEANI